MPDYYIVVDASCALLPVDDSTLCDPDMPPPRPELDCLATAKTFQKALPTIGLKLEPAKGTGAFLAIDRIERTEN